MRYLIQRTDTGAYYTGNRSELWTDDSASAYDFKYANRARARLGRLQRDLNLHLTNCQVSG